MRSEQNAYHSAVPFVDDLFKRLLNLELCVLRHVHQFVGKPFPHQIGKRLAEQIALPELLRILLEPFHEIPQHFFGLLLRADGTSVYMTQDIGTAKLRFDDYPINKMIYVVGNEQNYHFQVLSILLDKLGFEFGKGLVHFSYGMVELPEGKMKSREGTVVDADDLMEEMVGTAREISQELGKVDEMTPEEAENIARMVGLGSLKYFILKVDPRKNMTFNPKESIDFNGNTGPFIQYTYARIRSVLRKAAEQGIVLPEQLPTTTTISEKEENLIQMIADYASVVREAGKEYSPALIANYTYDLVKEYNQFYHDFSILREENEEVKKFRLVLSANVAKIVKSAMSLLGIEVPERM